ncbi:MAG TPA: DNA-deoxyinosine glycosylase [Burkholderiaceae bacterium]|jgi:hypoxanthine-DNA glycosylase
MKHIHYHYVMPSNSSQPLLAGLPPSLNADTRILILGSFPGEASLQAQQYYAHPRNQFWALLSAVLGEDLRKLDYPDRLRALQDHHIGLWDVIAVCAREGSLDSAIRNAQANDFAMLKHQCPNLHLVCFNGKTSGKFEPQFAHAGFRTLILPSSSPANAQWSFEQKLAAWQGIISAC